MIIDSSLQEQVDAQLLEQGAFASLDLLIDSGRLLHGDYESWRRGEIRNLDDVLMGDREKIKAQLEAAAGYARRIGLVEQLQTFHPWASGDAGRGAEPLWISTDPQLRRLIAGRYLPAQNAPQLDLFFDNPVVALTNGIVCALSALNLGDAQRQLDLLYAQAPNHADLAAFDRLLVALEHLGRPIDDPRRELEFLQQLTPTAKRLLGSQARDLLAPLWRQLADELASHAFSAGEPTLHRSFALCQSQDWSGVDDAVHGEPQWWLHASLCARLAQSSFYRQRRIQALKAWSHLCWRNPAQAAELLDGRHQPDTGMAQLWRRFIESADDIELQGGDLEPALTAADFPAWLLLYDPGLHLQLDAALGTGDTPAEANYRCVHRLLQARRANQHSEELELRKSLQAAHPILFRCLKHHVAGPVKPADRESR